MTDAMRWPIIRHARALIMVMRLLHRQEIVWLGRYPPGWFGDMKRILKVWNGEDIEHD